MNTVLYYFSATGNTLTTARMLAPELGECRLAPMASLREEQTVPVRAQAVGFVFPIYYGDMPYLVREVIGKMEFEGEPYIFGVCTYRGYYGEIAQRLDAVLRERGQKLSFMTHVPMPGNSRVSTPEQTTAILEKQQENVLRAAGELRPHPVMDYKAEKELPPTPVSIASNMRALEAEENCIGCGRCAQVCPMGNIRIQEGHALFGENCCTCLSCFHWCPVKAIWMPKGEEEMKRRSQYRHPDITLEDILAQKKDRKV